MKYLIISRSRTPILRDASPQAIQKGKDMLQAGMDQGIVEGAYILVSGGSVWIANVDSHETLARALRKFGIINYHDVDVLPIMDMHDTLSAYITHKQPTP